MPQYLSCWADGPDDHGALPSNKLNKCQFIYIVQQNYLQLPPTRVLINDDSVCPCLYFPKELDTEDIFSPFFDPLSIKLPAKIISTNESK